MRGCVGAWLPGAARLVSTDLTRLSLFASTRPASCSKKQKNKKTWQRTGSPLTVDHLQIGIRPAQDDTLSAPASRPRLRASKKTGPDHASVLVPLRPNLFFSRNKLGEARCSGDRHQPPCEKLLPPRTISGLARASPRDLVVWRQRPAFAVDKNLKHAKRRHAQGSPLTSRPRLGASCWFSRLSSSTLRPEHDVGIASVLPKTLDGRLQRLNAECAFFSQYRRLIVSTNPESFWGQVFSRRQWNPLFCKSGTVPPARRLQRRHVAWHDRRALLLCCKHQKKTTCFVSPVMLPQPIPAHTAPLPQATTRPDRPQTKAVRPSLTAHHQAPRLPSAA